MAIIMDPGGVSATGQSMHDIADAARDHTKTLLNSSDAAAAGNPGWAAGSALGGCRTAWQDQVGRLIEQTVAIGDNLKASASSVSTMDQEAEARLDHVMHDLIGQ